MITLVHLYPREMNIYGDTGNVLVLKKRLQWRNRDVRVVPINIGDPLPHDADILLGGGGQDAAQGDIGADFVLGGSGHNAGVINPPSRNKHGYWTGTAMPEDAEAWLAAATRHEGSWWPHWTAWLDTKGSGKTVPARTIADGIEPAPGRYATMP